MANLSEHLERVRSKPHHERRRIAFVASALITGTVALGWMGALASSNTLAIAAPGEGTGMHADLASTKTNFSELLGAAGAAIGATSSPAAVVVVDGATYSTLDERQENLNSTKQKVVTF
ncbi:MAG TPA: hypothetical protein VFY28_02615 [Candidatus Paceibacterota bacterium]|nr:hypothetical protein [Candidatus Paceibacterota bacterium]